MPKRYSLLLILIFSTNLCFAQKFVIDTSLSVNKLIGERFIKSDHDGVQIKNIKFKGERMAIGEYAFESLYQDLPYQGIILSTGNVMEARGPNNKVASTKLYRPGDADLESIMWDTQDATVVEFDFMPLTDSISFSFVFASEEYPTYVDRGVSDAFGFFVSDEESRIRINLARLPNSETPITVDYINHKRNTELFVLNKRWTGGIFNGTTREAENANLLQFNGFTREIHTGYKLQPYKIYHFKIAIADVGDMQLDSWVLLTGNSFASNGKVINPTGDDIARFYNEFTDQESEMDIAGDSISMMTKIHFAFNSAEIGQESHKGLEKIASILKYSHYKLLVNGYADETGGETYNLKLSQKRADAVMHYLLGLGIALERVNAQGRGELPGKDQKDKARKVEFVFMK